MASRRLRRSKILALGVAVLIALLGLIAYEAELDSVATTRTRLSGGEKPDIALQYLGGMRGPDGLYWATHNP